MSRLKSRPASALCRCCARRRQFGFARGQAGGAGIPPAVVGPDAAVGFQAGRVTQEDAGFVPAFPQVQQAGELVADVAGYEVGGPRRLGQRRGLVDLRQISRIRRT